MHVIKAENAWVCAKWQWNALDWCYWIALPASPVVQSSGTVLCVSLLIRTHLCVLTINPLHPLVILCAKVPYFVAGVLSVRPSQLERYIPTDLLDLKVVFKSDFGFYVIKKWVTIDFIDTMPIFIIWFNWNMMHSSGNKITLTTEGFVHSH